MYKIKAGSHSSVSLLWSPHNSFWQQVRSLPGHTPSFHQRRGGTSGALDFMSCSVHVCQVAKCSAGCLWRIMRSRVEWPRRTQDHGQRSGSQNAPEDGNSYGFGAGQYKVPLPARTCHDHCKLPGTAALYLLPTLFIGFIPCTDLLMQEKAQDYQSPARHHPISLFSSLPFFTGSQHFILLTLTPGNLVAGYLLSCPSVLNS